jgi:aryl-alcohol dehydrogenase-like predicted oxidoreductase
LPFIGRLGHRRCIYAGASETLEVVFAYRLRLGRVNRGRRGAAAFPPVDYDRAYNALDVMRGIAETHGVSVAQIALAWLLRQKVVSSVLVGAKRMDQLEDNLRAVNVSLADEEQADIAEVSKIPAEYPAWMIELWSQLRRTQLENSRR